MLEPASFRTPEGPLLARSLVDLLVFEHGDGALRAIQDDLAAGVPFRDALFSHTRLTITALEALWQDTIRGLLAPAPDDEAGQGVPPGTSDVPTGSSDSAN